MKAAVLIAIGLIWAGVALFLMTRDYGGIPLPTEFFPDSWRTPVVIVFLFIGNLGWLVPLVLGVSMAVTHRGSASD